MPADLSFLRVLDASDSVAGQFCGRLFADHGAEVVLLEPMSGTTTRRSEDLFWHLNCGKRSLVVDERARDTRDRPLLSATDLLIVDHGKSAFAGDLSAYPQLVVCWLSAFGEQGPYRQWQGTEIVYQAYSGAAYCTGAPGHEPLYGFGERASYSAGMAAYVTALAALYERDQSGLGQATHVSVAETAVSISQNLVSQYSYNGTYPDRERYDGPLGRYRCSDGWIALFVKPGFWSDACDAFGLKTLRDDPRFSDGEALIRNWPLASDLIADSVRSRRSQEVVEAGQALRMPVELVTDVADVYCCPDLAAHDYWIEVSTPVGTRRRLGSISRTSSQISPPDTRPPELGADTDAIVATWSKREPVASRAARVGDARTRPLDGIRVVELTTAWAGPMAGRTLAYLGAEVIKVEWRGRLDVWRGQRGSRRYPGGEPGERPYNRNNMFNTQNHDKLSVELDLKTCIGQEAVRNLIAKSDVVIGNLGPGVLKRLRLGYGDLTALRPDVILLEITGFGEHSGFSSHAAVGPTIEATTGGMKLISYADGQPQFTGFALLDPIGGITGAGMVLTALLARGRTVGGSHVDLSLREVALQWLGEYLIRYGRTGSSPEPLGNASPEAVPHGIYPAAGADEWIALAVETAPQWAALCELIGRSHWADDPTFTTIENRRQHTAEITSAIVGWSCQHSKREAAESLQARGVPASPVNSGRDLHDDPHLFATEFLNTMNHPDAGIHRYPGLPFRLDTTPGKISRPAPLLGADTEDVLHRILGWTDEQIAALQDEQIAAAENPRRQRESNPVR